jgi:hypothetical protein
MGISKLVFLLGLEKHDTKAMQEKHDTKAMQCMIMPPKMHKTKTKTTT